MFGFGKKTKVSKSIQNSMRDVLNGRYASPEDCSKLCNNEEGASWLLTESMIQMSNALAFVVSTKYSEDTYKWSSWDFFLKNIGKAIVDSTGNTDFLLITVKGIQRLQSIKGEGPERLQNMYANSADIVYEHDSTVDKVEIVNFLDERVQSFIHNLGEYFD